LAEAEQVRTELYPLGRKYCSRCKRWRLICDFGRNRDILRAECRTCDRIKKRVVNGMARRGKPFQARARKATAGIPRVYRNGRSDLDTGSPEFRAYMRKRYNNLTPKQIERRRESQRIWCEAKRREAGIKPREFKHRVTPTSKGEILRLDVEPFRQWLIEMHLRLTREQILELTGINERRLTYVLYESDKGKVSIDTVDAALVREGFTNLWELYPELYPDE
jgi:hypothetical protein